MEDGQKTSRLPIVKSGIKNYFANFKYLFTPIGVLSLGILLGLSVLIPCCIDSVRTLATRLAEITGDAHVDFDALWDTISDAVSALDWSEPAAALGKMMRASWIRETLLACAQSFVSEGATYGDLVLEAATEAGAQIVAGVVVLLFCTVLGIFAGHALTKCLVRREMAKRTFGKFLLATALESLAVVAWAIVVVLFAALWRPSMAICLAVTVLTWGFFALTEAYLVHCVKKVPFRRVVNMRSIGDLLLTNVILAAISVVLFLVAFAVNAVVGFVLGFALIEITAAVVQINAEHFAISQASSATAPTQTPHTTVEKS